MRLFHHPWDPETCAFYFYSFFLLSSGVWDKLKLIPRISWNPGVCPLLGNLILTFANYFIHLEGLRLQKSSWYTQKVVTGAYTPLCGSVSMDSRCLFSQNPTVGYGNKELVYHIVMFEVGWWIGWNSVRRDHLEKESFTFDGVHHPHPHSVTRQSALLQCCHKASRIPNPVHAIPMDSAHQRLLPMLGRPFIPWGKPEMQVSCDHTPTHSASRQPLFSISGPQHGSRHQAPVWSRVLFPPRALTSSLFCVQSVSTQHSTEVTLKSLQRLMVGSSPKLSLSTRLCMACLADSWSSLLSALQPHWPF